MNINLPIAALLALSTACLAERPMAWPDLPTKGFITGRPATNADVKSGNAVFSMDGKSLGALAITVPQYAILTDEQGVKHPVVVVQAERAPGGMKIVGLLGSDGSHTAATLPELQLLGTEKPH